MPKFQFADTSAADVSAALLILPVFEGPEAGPGVAEVGKALGASIPSFVGALVVSLVVLDRPARKAS